MNRDCDIRVGTLGHEGHGKSTLSAALLAVSAVGYDGDVERARGLAALALGWRPPGRLLLVDKVTSRCPFDYVRRG